MKRAFTYLLWIFSVLAFGLSTNPVQADVVTTYFHNDIFGTPMVATDVSGNLLWKETYRPYGERVLNQANPNNNKIWFGGKAQDPNTGLSYFGARYYNPQWGRFTGIDPKEVDPGNLYSFNRYAYANNNPYKYVDPNGESPLDIFFLAVDVVKLGIAIYTGTGIDDAVKDVAWSIVGVASPAPFVGQAGKAARIASVIGKAEEASDAAKIITKSADKWSRVPKSIQDQMTLGAAKKGAGNKIIDNLGDQNFKGMEKWEYKVKSENGQDSVVHYVRDPNTNELMDFKFKKHSTEDIKPWGNDPSVAPGDY